MITFKEFSKFNDKHRFFFKKKPNSKFIKIVYYVPVLIIMTFVFLILKAIVVAHKENKRKYPYRYDSKYKKVIKEGILFNTVEYHEK